MRPMSRPTLIDVSSWDLRSQIGSKIQQRLRVYRAPYGLSSASTGHPSAGPQVSPGLEGPYPAAQTALERQGCDRVWIAFVGHAVGCVSGDRDHSKAARTGVRRPIPVLTCGFVPEEAHSRTHSRSYGVQPTQAQPAIATSRRCSWQ